MRIEIAPRFSCDDWDQLKRKLEPRGDWAASPKEWERVIKVLESRIRTRFLETATRLEDERYAGFAILALDCLLIETIQAFKNGEHAKNSKQSRPVFISFLTLSARFQKFFTADLADGFYTNVRHGLLHDGETRKGWLVKTNPKYALLDPQPKGFLTTH